MHICFVNCCVPLLLIGLARLWEQRIIISQENAKPETPSCRPLVFCVGADRETRLIGIDSIRKANEHHLMPQPLVTDRPPFVSAV